MELRFDACVEGLTAKEITLQVAECSDSLHNIWHSFRELSAFSFFKCKNIDGPRQHIQTRALGTLKALREKCDRYVTHYCCSHAAWLALNPHQTFDGRKWEQILHILKKSDLTFPGDNEKEDGFENEATTSAACTLHSTSGMGGNAKKWQQQKGGEGYKQFTWIWQVQKQDERDIPGLNGNASEKDVHSRKISLSIGFNIANLHFRLRIEWAWTQLHAYRWDEERRLLLEEMRHTVTTHIGTHDLWLSWLHMWSDVSPDVLHGLNAYSHCQANIYYMLVVSFIKIWSPELWKNNITVEWPLELAKLTARAEAIPERKSGQKKAKLAHTSSSKSDNGSAGIHLGDGHLDSDSEPLVGSEDTIKFDGETSGESVLLHLVHYTDSEDSE